MLTDPVFVLLSPLDVAKGEFACPLCRSVVRTHTRYRTVAPAMY
jgi:hypothetical protein